MVKGFQSPFLINASLWEAGYANPQTLIQNVPERIKVTLEGSQYQGTLIQKHLKLGHICICLTRS